MTLKQSKRSRRKPDLNFSPAEERELRKMGAGELLRGMKRTARGETTPMSRAFGRMSHRLCVAIRSACPEISGKLLGRLVVRLLNTVEYGEHLSEKLRHITRVKGRFRRADLRSVLMLAHEVDLWALRRQVEGLRRDIPLLLKRLEARGSDRRKRQ